MQGAQEAQAASAELLSSAEAPVNAPEASGKEENGWKLTQGGDAAILEGNT